MAQSSSPPTHSLALASPHPPPPPQMPPTKLHGRAFYQSIGSPKMIVAPMVDRSEFAWRMLTRSYMDHESSKSLLAYSPMLHARLFTSTPKFRDAHFQPIREGWGSEKDSSASSSSQPWLDGNPSIDRPLFVQFCANKPDELLEAARYVAPYCDAVDLNLGCPQGIAKSGHYGAFLQEDWDLIYKLINKLHQELSIPVTAKMRILDTKERTLEYAKMIMSAGASILTVHGRRREQKGHNMGVADWSMIRYLRDNLPPETVIFANGNILNRHDIQPCLEATGADGIMSAEGNLSDPTIFSTPPTNKEDREYWRGRDGEEGYRIDGVVRRYLDIIYQFVLEEPRPERPQLYLPSDPPLSPEQIQQSEEATTVEEPPRKKRKTSKAARTSSPSLKAMQGHLFQLLRPILSTHTDIRDALAKTRAGDLAAFEGVLSMLEEAVKKALQLHTTAQTPPLSNGHAPEEANAEAEEVEHNDEASSKDNLAQYRKPWWICQPYIRPLPEEAVKLGALTMSKKDKAKVEKGVSSDAVVKEDAVATNDGPSDSKDVESELPRPALVCG